MIDGINNTDIVVFSQMYREHSEVKLIASKVLFSNWIHSFLTDQVLGTGHKMVWNSYYDNLFAGNFKRRCQLTILASWKFVACFLESTSIWRRN